MPKTLTNLKLHELPAEFEELDALVEELAGWDYLADNAEPDELMIDSIEREALIEQINRKAERLLARLQDKGASFHSWLVGLRYDAEAAESELKRVRKIAKTRANKLERVKTYVRDTLLLMGMKRIDFDGGRLRVQANGGKLPIEWDGRTPVPPALAEPVKLDPAQLLERLRIALEHAAGGMNDTNPAYASDEELLQYLGIDPASLTPSLDRVHQAIAANGGEVPAGFTVLERGSHWRVE